MRRWYAHSGMRTVPLVLKYHGSAAAGTSAIIESPLVAAMEPAMEGVVAAEATEVESKLSKQNFF